MITVTVENYKTLNVCGLSIEFKMRIQQYITYNSFVAVFIKPEKSDPEFGSELTTGEIIFVNNQGKYWEYIGRAISKIWKIDDHILGVYEKQVNLWIDVNKKEFIKMVWNPLDIDDPQDTINVVKENYKSLKISNSIIEFPGPINQYVLYEKFLAVSLYSIDANSQFSSLGGNIFFANENGIFWQLPSIKHTYMSNIWKINNNTLGIYDGQYDLWLDINTEEYIKEIWNPWGMLNPEKYYTKDWKKTKKKNNKKTKTQKKTKVD